MANNQSTSESSCDGDCNNAVIHGEGLKYHKVLKGARVHAPTQHIDYMF